jgi:hypothetical protein
MGHNEVTKMLNLIVAYVLGIVSAFVLLLLLVTHRAPPPTMAKRRQPNAQGEKREEPTEPLYMYGVTGEEQ